MFSPSSLVLFLQKDILKRKKEKQLALIDPPTFVVAPKGFCIQSYAVIIEVLFLVENISVVLGSFFHLESKMKIKACLWGDLAHQSLMDIARKSD